MLKEQAAALSLKELNKNNVGDAISSRIYSRYTPEG